ncbi:hypothetical protein AB7M56_008382 [Bradyrhizobium elkanii]|nr:hypothetical protein [Bradyrhizobium elkanii]MCP1974479.1 hypothetical protein [Bradyrhizobium elkanii]MCP1979090.1 hypothetical protein [Bradyrhizobium elkanii]MCS3475552.1 hypothetical protein [Bradyrhizobium elkanii]MCS3521558.1 hypothetical protein [Bradyrhizobium elkanii]
MAHWARGRRKRRGAGKRSPNLEIGLAEKPERLADFKILL